MPFWPAYKEPKMSEKETDEKSIGTYIAFGAALGAGIGTAFGVALGNIALGVALGPGIGVAMGIALWSARKANDSSDGEQQ
jgi:hypothetical protein